MSQGSDLKALARRAYLSYHQDGLIDVLIGWMVFAFGLRLLIDSAVISFFAWFPILFYVPFKNALTVPRLGYVKFNEDFSQKKLTRRGLVLAGALVLIVLVTTAYMLVTKNAFGSLTQLSDSGLLIYGSVATLLLLISGILSSLWRLAVYGFLCAALTIVGMVLSLPDYILYIVLGLVILLGGAGLMIRFIHKYPTAHDKVDHDLE